MQDIEKLFYCKCIEMNRFKYSAFGREANRTLKYLKVPKEIPNWIYETKIEDMSNLSKSIISNELVIDFSKFKSFKIDDLFQVTGSKTTSKSQLKKNEKGKYPYVTTQSINNGVEGFYNYYTEEGNILVIDSAVKGYCSYQSEKFTASDHVEKLIPKFKLNKFIAIFLTTILNLEQFRYSYGRKFNQERIKNTMINLPAIYNKTPDWQFMEDYIKSLPYSKAIV
ncbi:MAG: restriction endonuclease subunit S [Nanoarchaeota archaeon]|nr:restriction endonuclease subunit S [Nanoarchaeota archaeon]